MQQLPFSVDRSSLIPLHAQLVQSIRGAILSGRLAYGEKLPSENEMVAGLSLSRFTVRTALAALAADHYIEKQHGRGTYVCYRDTAPRGNIDVLLDVTYSFFSTMYIKSISEVLAAANYRFVIHNTEDSPETVCAALEQLSGKGSAGVILLPPHVLQESCPAMTDALVGLGAQGIPLVILDRRLEGVGAAQIVFDDFAGGKRAAEYLLSLGHRRIAMVCRSSFAENEARLHGFNAVLAMNGLPPVCEIEEDEHTEAQLLRLIREEEISALFSYNDETALKVMRILDQAGIRIPADVSVMGYDDTILARTVQPALTSVIHPKEALGRMAAEKLISLIEGRDYLPPAEALEARVHVRASCDVARTLR